MSNAAIPMNKEAAERRFSKNQIVTLLITVVGLALVAYGLVTVNAWRQIDPQAISEARVAKEEGLTRAQQSSLYERQFDAAVGQKARLIRTALIFILLGGLVLWISRHWQSWRDLYGEQMLYAYSFLIPPVGWILYLFAYRTQDDPNRVVIRRNIGIMSISLVAGLVAYFIIDWVQNTIISGFVTGDEGFVANIINLLVTPQLGWIVGIIVGGYVAFRTRDVRAIAVAGQLVVLGIILAVLSWFGGNAQTGIEDRGLSVTDYRFLDLTSGFDISETLITYSRSSTYGQAFLAGFLNTIMISVVGIFLATILGFLVGISRLSSNWLISTIARIYVELMRNIPLLVLLFFLYAGVLLQLPQRADTIRLFNDSILLNNRGVALPWYRATETFSAWVPFLVIGALIAAVIWFIRNRPVKVTGRPAFSFLYVILGLVIVPIIGWFIVSPMQLEIPFIDGLNYAKNQETDSFVGLVMSPEFAGVLFGLVLYTAAFIGEVVRAGINAVSRGQREAATAIGLTQGQSMQLIIIPQALRVIIPPLTNQYLNLAKNSSLAIAIGYADLFFVANTTFNQSGQSVQVVLMIMASYLLISLTISAVMNYLNGRMQLKER